VDLTTKLAALSQRIARIREVHRGNVDLTAGEDRLDLVSYNLLVAVEQCLDIANDLVADPGWEPATSLDESLGLLVEEGAISRKSLLVLRQSAEIRDLILHDYSTIDPARVNAAANGIADLERFAEEATTSAFSRRRWRTRPRSRMICSTPSAGRKE
jgi:uncharacterized protein YutE (UPF0331/DUF86 family)